jgi:hypothetical protein
LPLVATLAALSLSAVPALADPGATGPIATAGAAVPPPALPESEPERIDAVADSRTESEPVRDNKVHGFVEAGVGTGGYRQAAVGIDAPLPNGGEVAIAVAATQLDGALGRR